MNIHYRSPPSRVLRKFGPRFLTAYMHAGMSGLIAKINSTLDQKWQVQWLIALTLHLDETRWKMVVAWFRAFHQTNTDPAVRNLLLHLEPIAEKYASFRTNELKDEEATNKMLEELRMGFGPLLSDQGV